MVGNDTQNMEVKVYKELKHAILTRQLYPNSQLVEATIAEKLGVSRTPIRSALKQLAYEGLVNIIPRKGAFIVQPTKEEFMQLFSCRLLLEKEAIRLATKQIISTDIDSLELLMKEEKESYLNKDFEKFLSANKKMHMTIVKATGNKYYIKFIEELLTKSDIYLIFYDKFYTKPIEESNSVKEHKQLFEALKARDPDESAKAMEYHIKSIFENLNLILVQKPCFLTSKTV